MAYGKVHETFWDDPLLRGLSEPARHLMLYLITCRHRNRFGCYVLDFGYASSDLQWSAGKVAETVAELCSVDRIRYDATHRVVLIPRYLKHNTMENHKVVAGAIVELKGLPETPLLDGLRAAVEKYKRPHYLPFLQALSNRIGNGIPNDMANDNGNGMPYRGTALSVSVAVTGTITEPEPSLPQDDDAQEMPVAVAFDAPAGAHEEPAGQLPPPAPEAAGSDQQRLIRSMVAAVKRHTANLGDVARKSFHAAAEPIIRGHDYTAWADHTGSQVPWSDRPRLLELALARVSAGTSKDLRQGLRYVIPQQYDPFERTRAERPAAGSEYEAVEAGGRARQTPQDTTAKRNGKMTRVDGLDPEKEQREAEKKDIQELADWERDNPSEAEQLLEAVTREMATDPKWKDADEVAVMIAGTGLYRKRIRERIEASARAGAA